MSSLLASAALLALCAAAMPATANQQVYTTLLSGSAENPTNASLGGGAGVVTFDLDLLTMRVQTTFAGLSGNVTASHIHCCVAAPGNVGVATMTPTFTGFPLGASFGSYDHTFDMTLASSYNPSFITANGGTVSSAFSALLAGLGAGKAYLNIHSTFAPGGEIRGNLDLVVAACTYSLSPLDLSNRAPVSGSAAIVVTTPSGCSVTVTTFQPWVAVASIVPSGGTTTVTLNLTMNAGAARATSIQVVDRLFLITQQATP